MYRYKVSYTLFNIVICSVYYAYFSKTGVILYVLAWLSSYISLRWKDSNIRKYLLNKHYPGVYEYFELKTKRGRHG